MLLSDTDILEGLRNGEIVISPFRRECLGSNSYDVHLAKTVMMYDCDVFDCKEDASKHLKTWWIGDEGMLLRPGQLYLMATDEYTETHTAVPFLEGKSSLGRLGVSIHVTAGKGDVGFCNHWTMEVTVVKPTRVYAGMPIGQLIYHRVSPNVEVPYGAKASQKYQSGGPQGVPTPTGSKMHKNWNANTQSWK